MSEKRRNQVRATVNLSNTKENPTRMLVLPAGPHYLSVLKGARKASLVRDMPSSKSAHMQCHVLRTRQTNDLLADAASQIGTFHRAAECMVTSTTDPSAQTAPPSWEQSAVAPVAILSR